MSEIKKRMLQYLDSVYVTEYQFCKKVGISHGVLKKKTGVSEDIIIKFIQEHPEVDINWLITGHKKGEPNSVKEKKEQPEIHKIKGKKLPSRNATKLEAIHNEMKNMLVEMKTLKEDFQNQKILIDSLSKDYHTTNTTKKKRPVIKSIYNVIKEKEVLTEIKGLKTAVTNQKTIIKSIDQKLSHAGIRGNSPYKRYNKPTVIKNIQASLGSRRCNMANKNRSY